MYYIIHVSIISWNNNQWTLTTTSTSISASSEPFTSTLTSISIFGLYSGFVVELLVTGGQEVVWLVPGGVSVVVEFWQFLFNILM